MRDSMKNLTDELPELRDSKQQDLMSDLARIDAEMEAAMATEESVHQKAAETRAKREEVALAFALSS